MEVFLEQYGLLAIAIILFIDDLGIPLPGTTIIFSAVIYQRTVSADFPVELFLISLFIPPICNGLLFYWGRNGARKWLDTHGHKIFLPNKRLKNAEKSFAKYQEKTMFFSALVPSVRAVTSVIAGGLKIPYVTFFFYHLSGITLWASVVVGGGYFLGEEIWNTIKGSFNVIIGLVILFFITRFLLRYVSFSK